MKKLFFLCLMFSLIVPTVVEAKKRRIEDSKAYWELKDGVLTISGKGRIIDGAFYLWKGERIEKIIIEHGITSIGDYAFSEITYDLSHNEHCLKSVEIANSVTSIGEGVFCGCSFLESIIIPNSVTFIGKKAFLDCYSLKSISIPNSVTAIRDSVFFGCNRLESISIPNSVTTIGERAFFQCFHLKTLSIPNSVRYIGKMALHGFLGKFTTIPAYMANCEPSKWEEWGLSGSHLSKALEKRFFDEEKRNREITILANGYFVDDDGAKGILDRNGKWIVPCSYVWSRFSEFSPIDGGFVKVKNNDGLGIYTKDRIEIIPTGRGYTSIDYNSINKTFTFTKKGMKGVCDLSGTEISITRLPLSESEIKSQGQYDYAGLLKDGTTEYYKVRKNSRYGLTDAYGNEIVPAKFEALEQAGTGFLRYKLNGFWGVMNYTGKIIIDTDRRYTSVGDYVTLTKRFPYTMVGYKGECDFNGRQISKKRVTESQQVASTSSAMFNKVKDLGTFDLKGNVKSCQWVLSAKIDNVLFPFSEKLLFTSQGKIANKSLIIERDSIGRLSKISNNVRVVEYQYDNDGKLSATYDYFKDLKLAPHYLTLIEYDKKRVKEVRIMGGGLNIFDSLSNLLSVFDLKNNQNDDEIYEYKYLKFDKVGNWTKRQFIAKEYDFLLGEEYETTVTEERKILYY